LGYDKYYVQGGDWGSFISYVMAVRFPERLAGVHLNAASRAENLKTNLKLLVGAFFPNLIYGPDEIDRFYPLSGTFKEILGEVGYFLLQSTKPDTVGAALQDSPAGLAAYILEKFSTWTNKDNRVKSDGGLTDKFTIDELLNDVMIYWVTGSITSSQRFYKETMSSIPLTMWLPVTKVPAGVTICPKEASVFQSPRTLLEDKFSILLTYTKMPSCGHFAAYEEPVLLANDIWKFVEAVINRETQLKEEAKKQTLNKP
jgi:pimeloyl-ACP methyl ester carboxylesterase